MGDNSPHFSKTAIALPVLSAGVGGLIKSDLLVWVEMGGNV